MSTRQCREYREFSEYLSGVLRDDECEAFEEHLAECEHCIETLGSFDSVVEETLAELRIPPTVNVLEQEAACLESLQAIKQLTDELFRGNSKSTANAAFALPAQIRDYQLLRVLGQGGMGTVYEAFHSRLQRLVALKVLLANRIHDLDAVRRFEREMQLVGRMRNRHIVEAIDAGEQQGTHYLVMELIHGVDLSSAVRKTGPLSVADASEIARQTAEGLSYIHEQGMVHRDIKPSNLMLAAHEGIPTVKILDLGLARLQLNDAADELTTAGQLMGTLEYMAPEQTRAHSQVDSRADIYSLGATLFKLLVGKAPFESALHNTSVKKLRAVDSERPPLVSTLRSTVPKKLAQLIDRMLSKSPSRRPVSAAEVSRLLVPYAKGHRLGQLLTKSIATEASGLNESGTPPFTNALTSVEPKAKEGGTPPNRPTGGYRRIVLLGLPAACLLATVIFFSLRGPHQGIVRIEINDPEMVVTIGEDSYSVVNSGKEIRISPGEKMLSIRRGDLKFETTRLQIGKGKNPDLLVEFFENAAVVEFAGKQLRLDTSGEKTPPVVEAVNNPSGNQPDDPVASDRSAIQWLLEHQAKIEVLSKQGSAAIKSPAELPAESFTVVSVKLAGMPVFTREHAEHLARLKDMVQLEIHSSKVEDGSTQPLRVLTSLRDLSLTGAEFRGEHVAFLANLKALRSLYFESAMDDASLEYLAPLDHLESLKLVRSPATGRGFDKLSHLTQLHIVDMGDSQLDDGGMEQIVKLPSLHVFWAIRTKLSNAGLKHVQGHPSLDTLILQETPVTDAGLPNLYQLKLLRVHAVGTAVTVEGAIALQSHVPSCVVEFSAKGKKIYLPPILAFSQDQQRTLAHWILNHGGAVNRSQEVGRIDDKNFKLQRVTLSDINDQLFASIVNDLRNCPDLYDLTISGDGLTAASLPLLATLPVSVLDFSGVEATEAEYDVLKNNPSLTELTLTKSVSGEAFIRAAAKMPNLTFLGLNGCRLAGDESLRPLVQLKSLERIFLATDDLTDDSIEILKQIASLKNIRLASKNVSDGIWPKLASIPQLEVLNLNALGDANRQQLTGQGISALAGLPHFHSLYLNLCPLSEQGFMELGQLTQLEWLNFYETKVEDRHLAHFHKLSQLRDLELFSTMVTNDGVAMLQKALPKCQIRIPPEN